MDAVEAAADDGASRSASDEEDAYVPLPSDKADFDYDAFKAKQPGLCLKVGRGERTDGESFAGAPSRGRGRGRQGPRPGRSSGSNPFAALQRSSPQGAPKRKRGINTKTASFAR